MSADNLSAAEQTGISFACIMQFVKKNWKKIFAFGIFTLLLTAIIFAALYFLIPKTSVLSLEIGIQLPKEKGKIVYPSKKDFSANDIISVPVLRKVYQDNKLSGKIKFDEFCQLFYISGSNIEKAIITASFKNKLSDKKLTLVDIKKLEDEYTQALQGLDTCKVEIAMTPTLKFDALLATKILNDIPKAWFEIYSIQEGKVMPQFTSAAQINDLRTMLPVDGWLITLDKIRKISNDLLLGCDALNEMLGGRQIALSSGESFKELQSSLDNFNRHRIGTVTQLVLNTPSYQSQFDKMYLNSNIIAVTGKVNAEKAKYDATVDAINIIHPAAVDASGKNGTPAMEKTASVTMNFDATFFSSMSSLIRSYSSIALREKYANKALECKMNLAALEAEKDYYSMLLAQLNSSKSSVSTIGKDQLQKIEQNMFDELAALCGKFNEFNALLMGDCFTSSRFFAASGEVLRYSQFSISITRLAVGLFFLFVLANVLFISKLAYADYVEREQNK